MREDRDSARCPDRLDDRLRVRMIALAACPRSDPQSCPCISERSALVRRAMIKVDGLPVHSDSQNMVDRHVNGIAGVPLDAGQDKETVVLPQMPDFPVVGDGNEVVTGLAIYIDGLHRIQRAVRHRRVHVEVSFVPISSVLKNSHFFTVF